jgi:B12-binding domain/radical SAM domain protein
VSRPDVVLIHPPSVFDFREREIRYGPISDVIPSSPVFEMYPVGFLTLAAHLRKHGYRVRIVNLALRMMRDRKFRPERFLRRLRPRLFGIDLHWLPHAHGGPAVAALLKQLHPDIPIVFGGISATYFHKELIEDRNVDFVLRGSVTEPSLLALVQQLENGREFGRVAGLTWKESGAVRINRDTEGSSLDPYGFDLGSMVWSVMRHLDFWTTLPFHFWWRHPITAVFTVRGCRRGCVTCGASSAAFRRFMPAPHPLLRSPEAIAAMVRDLAEITRAPIFLVGDLRDGGEPYAQAVLDALARSRVSNRITFEFFDPPSPGFLEKIDAAIPHWAAELSPESHDESVRALLGKAKFSNPAMKTSIDAMMRLRCEQLDLFYMVGLPGQTYQSVFDTVESIRDLFARYDRRLSAFITPVAPFIDPGSDGFEQAEQRGYRIFARTLAEHQALLRENDWATTLNYETAWMTRAEIASASYAAAARLRDLKVQYGRTALSNKLELFPPGPILRNFRIRGIVRLLVRGFFRLLP